MRINMIGGGFQHDVCSSALNKNKHVEWVKDESSKISIHIDNAILLNINPHKDNYGWFAESSSIIPTIIDSVKNNIDLYKEKFKYIFTHDKRVIELNPEFFKFTPPNALPWVQTKQIYSKDKLASFIVSNKMMTNGHKFRLDALNKVKHRVDHFGRGFSNQLPWSYFDSKGVEESGKLHALKDYYFSFAFENDNYPSIFCEKITDCFATGTVPIFWGTPDIGDYFDINGIIVFDDNFNVDSLSPELYYSKMDYIKNNFEKCLELCSSEDYIYKNYLS